MRPSLLPHGRTARRLGWAHLPPGVRRAVEERLGAPVTASASQDGGFTPGLASVLECADGGRHFVKAASVKAQRVFAEAYREEARKLAALPAATPAPRLLWTLEVEDWYVLCTEYVAARAPRRPWEAVDLRRCLDTLAGAVSTLTPPPAGLQLPEAAEELAGWPACWDRLTDLAHHQEAAELAARHAEATVGETLVHFDVRDDNLLLTADGRVLLCDWNWPMVGAAWLDSLMLLIGPRGDGLDVEDVIARHRLLAAVPADHIDVVLALAAGYLLTSAREPVPATSPYLREAQRWQGEVCWEWLRERRRWG